MPGQLDTFNCLKIQTINIKKHLLHCNILLVSTVGCGILIYLVATSLAEILFAVTVAVVVAMVTTTMALRSVTELTFL